MRTRVAAFLLCIAIAPEAPAESTAGTAREISSPPRSTCKADSIATAFACDLSNVSIALAQTITGAALGKPVHGYRYTDNAYPVYGYLLNSSGWNNSLSGNDGRTAAVFSRVHVYQAGQGDAVAYNATGFAASACRPGSTSFLACPAVSLFNGDISAGTNGAYLNPYETVLNDRGYSVAAIGNVNNLVRTSAGRNLGDEWWAGYRVQSKGAVAADVAYSAVGPFNIGVDLSFVSLPTHPMGAAPANCVQCALTLAPEQRIYFAAVASDSSSLSRFPASPGSTWVSYQTRHEALQLIVGGVEAAAFTASAAYFGAEGKLMLRAGQGGSEITTTAGDMTIHSAAGTTTFDDKQVIVKEALTLPTVAPLSPLCTDSSHRVTSSCTGVAASSSGASFPLSGSTGPIGGQPLAAGKCATQAINLPRSEPSMAVVVSPVTFPGEGFYWQAYVSARDVVTVRVCAALAGTPAASKYNVRVFQ